ncbi:hypothetical protein CANCADRAFT_49263 [Tortispora caseinolytica NRRL Y-17796]|uniref:Mitochondrial distribution and morphology protein 35 n=1 Tax=Tortispora caseinolytica NRRL Y-17796 TaxID=767744 RepID=A0A1E4TML7_9ASCO|nr:hypothetical protein CANCADRAFT_49263 [Tortispora caseinolytica NRRL Y-17796]
MSASFAEECTELKKKYDGCFNNWYSEKFLKGLSMENECADEWSEYEACFKNALRQKGLMPMLEDAREDAPFEDGGRLKGDK